MTFEPGVGVHLEAYTKHYEKHSHHKQPSMDIVLKKTQRNAFILSRDPQSICARCVTFEPGVGVHLEVYTKHCEKHSHLKQPSMDIVLKKTQRNAFILSRDPQSICARCVTFEPGVGVHLEVYTKHCEKHSHLKQPSMDIVLKK